MSLSKDRYEYTLEKKNLGNAVTYDLLQSQNAYLSDSSTYLLQKMALRTAVMNLNLLLAEDYNKEFILTDTFNVQKSSFDYEDLKKQMLSNNKTLKNQYINQSILKNNIRLAKSGLYPNISMSSGYDQSISKLKFEGINPIDANSYDYYVNFSLNFNLFNGVKQNAPSAMRNLAKISEIYN